MYIGLYLNIIYIRSVLAPSNVHCIMVIVTWFVPSFYQDSASSAHIHGLYEVGCIDMSINCTGMFLNTLYILDGSLSHSDVIPDHNLP